MPAYSRPIPLPAILACAFGARGRTVHAATLDLSSPSGLPVGPTALTRTVDGVEVSDQGFSAEIGTEGDDATVFGPFPTGPGALALPVFGIDQGASGARG